MDGDTARDRLQNAEPRLTHPDESPHLKKLYKEVYDCVCIFYTVVMEEAVHIFIQRSWHSRSLC